MKELINRFLNWLRIKPKEEFKPTPVEFKMWPFPVEEPKPKRKPRVAKATTRPAKKPAAKKIVKNAEKIVKKKAK